MKIWIKIAIYALLAAAIITLSGLYFESCKHVSSLKFQVKEQTHIIDSLLARRMTLFDVKLQVTDKNIIHGRYNKGTINMPQERTYTLSIDSMNIKIK
ncbi:MAG: hypothetical protein LBR79_02600 [Oscillospiraceae bacterium]|jgi:hypothetical protein|nr:hypothetical protein [Oscillospiraceae bacterium]